MLVPVLEIVMRFSVRELTARLRMCIAGRESVVTARIVGFGSTATSYRWGDGAVIARAEGSVRLALPRVFLSLRAPIQVYVDVMDRPIGRHASRGRREWTFAKGGLAALRQVYFGTVGTTVALATGSV